MAGRLNTSWSRLGLTLGWLDVEWLNDSVVADSEIATLKKTVTPYGFSNNKFQQKILTAYSCETSNAIEIEEYRIQRRTFPVNYYRLPEGNNDWQTVKHRRRRA